MRSVLGKARLLLEAFDADSGALSLTELTRRSGVAKATTHRLANGLVEWGVLERPAASSPCRARPEQGTPLPRDRGQEQSFDRRGKVGVVNSRARRVKVSPIPSAAARTDVA